MMTEKKLKIGIIGVGNISNEHIQAYLNNPRIELYAFCDIDEKQLALMAEKYGVSRTFTDKDEMLALPEAGRGERVYLELPARTCTIAALNAQACLCESHGD